MLLLPSSGWDFHLAIHLEYFHSWAVWKFYTMASTNEMLELEDQFESFKSGVWEEIWFLVSHNSNGERVVDKTRTVCRRCSSIVNEKKRIHMHLFFSPPLYHALSEPWILNRSRNRTMIVYLYSPRRNSWSFWQSQLIAVKRERTLFADKSHCDWLSLA